MKDIKKAHFIGICGVGMGATAELLKSDGWEISGSDDGFYPPMSERLERSGISFHTPYDPANIPADADLIVIGKNAKLVAETNPEVKAVFESGIRVVSFPEVIGERIAGKENMIVTGSYGKSTVSALLAHILVSAGKDPSYFIGAIPLNDLPLAHIGTSGISVIEGDEYPTSNTDPRSKFLHYHPHDVLITSAAHDHVNVFPTINDYLAPFKELLALAPVDGLRIGCIDAPHVRDLLAPYENAITYGFDANAQWRVTDMHFNETSSFTLTHNGTHIATLEMQLLGKHNIQNIIGASALLLEKELVTISELQEGVRTFRGIKRRLDKKTSNTSVAVYEGFGSSYEKMRAGIDALRLHFPERRKVVLFEPHTFSWRNRDALYWYDDVFADTDIVFVYEPATQGAGTHKQLSQEEIVTRVREAGFDVRAITDPDAGFAAITEELRSGDVVLCSTSGDLGGLMPRIVGFVERTFST